MSFSVNPTITESESLAVFIKNWAVGKGDLIISNKFVLEPHIEGEKAPCDVLYQEEFGIGEPSDEMIDAMLDSIEGKSYDRIIAIGGGSVIDIAKLFVFGSGLTCSEIFEKNSTLPRKRKLIIIPTTCGTGSEVTGISIVEFKKKKTKVGLASPLLFAEEAVLIPAMLSTLPYEIFAATSIDALIHAVESYVSPKSNLFVRANGRSAIELILNGYKAIAATGKRECPSDMQDFLYASTLAGIAFENAGCAAVHALSYPIGGLFHVAHGKANYIVFNGVFSKYRELGADLSALESVLQAVLDCNAENVWEALFALIDKILIRPVLRDYGVDDAKCTEMAASVITNQQRLLANNPIPLSERDVYEVFKACV